MAPSGKRGSHEEDAVHRRADGDHPPPNLRTKVFPQFLFRSARAASVQIYAVLHERRHSTGAGSDSLSSTGTLAYAGTLSTPGRLTWFDRGGTPSDSAGSLGDYTDFRLSPDQTRLAASVADPKTGFADIWIMDLARGGSAPFTFGPPVNAAPVWAPDGARIIFRATRASGITEFYAKSAGG